MNNTLPTIAEDRGISLEIWSALTNSLYAGAKPESVALVWDYCKARQLDPLKKPCHIVPMYIEDKVTGQKAMRDVIMPGIYELRMTAQRTGEYAGQDAPIYGQMIDMSIGGEQINAPESCTVTVYRIIQGQRMGISHTEFFDEAVGTVKSGAPNSMWKKRKRGQLAKTAEAGALRKAFPDELGGEMSSDEMEGKYIGDPIEVEATVLEGYSQHRFDECLPQWISLVQRGSKSADAIISQITSSYALNEQQLEDIQVLRKTHILEASEEPAEAE